MGLIASGDDCWSDDQWHVQQRW